MPKITASPALSRFRVLDLSRVRAGPNCVRVLADFGADVIRIEPPQGIDPNEAMFAANRMSGDFQNLNRNKRSMTLNLKKPGALDKSRTVAEWVDALNNAGVPAGQVYTVPEVFEDEQVRHLGVQAPLNLPQGHTMHYITQPITLTRTPSKLERQAPGWGEHTDEILREAGCGDAQIEQLHADGVV